ncbi:hypothetical protein NDU88_006907 [Pleurodeles waltl]|uniref:Uncharacterized protein n=1 Tax=Pleurodeles waltl TaxID=8319 RepID=A0AAV7SQU2_PLEWA|nr:hypothetical protein NDU88_006907 [Pleurodeles waltl]
MSSVKPSQQLLFTGVVQQSQPETASLPRHPIPGTHDGPDSERNHCGWLYLEVTDVKMSRSIRAYIVGFNVMVDQRLSAVEEKLNCILDQGAELWHLNNKLTDL